MPPVARKFVVTPEVDAQYINGIEVRVSPAPTGGQHISFDAVLNKFVYSSPVGGLNYQGTWDALLNVPPLASGVGTQGDYYVVSVAGNTNLDGITDWKIGDWAIFNGTAWQKIDQSIPFGINPGDVPAIGAMLGNNQVVETDGSGALISAVKNTADNKNFGIGVADVSVGNHTHNGVNSLAVPHSNLSGVTASQHHADLQVVTGAGVPQTGQKAYRQETNYTNGGLAVTFGVPTVFAVVPNIQITIEDLGIITNPRGFTYVISSLTVNGFTITVYKFYQVGPNLVFAQAATNDCKVHIRAEAA